ncbi:hypothetical protein AB0E88_15385 [Streptomyces sp. NPDC028635]
MTTRAALCDAARVVVMGDGAMPETGTHDELLHRGGARMALHAPQAA